MIEIKPFSIALKNSLLVLPFLAVTVSAFKTNTLNPKRTNQSLAFRLDTMPRTITVTQKANPSNSSTLHWNCGPSKIDPNKVPLWIVDGKEISDEEIKNINPNTIQSIDVLKNNALANKYGDKGKNGVILITLKKSPPITFNNPR